MQQSMRQNSPHFDLEGRLQGLQALQDSEIGEASSALPMSNIEYVWVPVEKVLLTEVNVPGKKATEWQAALPFVLEERLAQPVESLHFAVLHRDNDADLAGLTYVAVVDKTLMQQWLDELKVYGLENVALIPSCFRMAYPEQKTSEKSAIWIAEEQAEQENNKLVRTGLFSGMVVSDTLSKQLFDLEKKAHPALVWQQPENFIQNYSELKGFNLRQGEYQSIAESNPYWKQWQLAVFLVVFGFAFILGEAWWQTQQVLQEKQVYKAQTTQLFKKMFPNTKRIVNIRAQTKTNLKETQSGANLAGPSMIMKKLEPTLLPLMNTGQLVLEKVNWRKAQLVLTVTASDSQDLEKWITTLKGQMKGNPRLKLKNVQAQKVEAEVYVDSH